ncbi:MAG TPA: hypothetical protein VFJ61_13905 [Solirubrobacterales bacterium]|nr:hypothetical protein [Solirubrobacterales bacterium]
MLVCAAAFMGIGAPAASAAPEAGPGWTHLKTFAVKDTYPFNLFDPTTSPIAVDSHGYVFTVDQNQSVVRFYDPGKAPGEELLGAFSTGARDIAIDRNDDTVYVDEVSSFGGTTINRFVSDGKPTPTYTRDPGFAVTEGQGLAVDQTTGNLLVTDAGAEAVRRYDSTGKLLGTIPTPGVASAFILTLPDGSFFVAPGEGGDLTHFSGAGAALGSIAGVGTIQGLAYDEARSVVVVSSGGVLTTYSLAGAALAKSPAFINDGVGIAVAPVSSALYEHSRESQNAYSPVIVPDLTAPIVSAVGPHVAHLSTEVDPGSGPPAGSKMRFEISSDNGQTWISTPDQSVNAAGTFEADLTGLLPNLDYLVRAVAYNDGVSKTTDPVAFSTPEIAPEVVTGDATDVSETGAVLNGTINPGGVQTTYHFEYGTSTAYGSRIPLNVEGAAGSGRVSKIFSRSIEDLQPGTTYHFRLVAENEFGLTEGLDQTFTTPVASDILHRFYEQVTPPEKNGNAIDPKYGPLPKEDGEGLFYVRKAGSEGAPLNSGSVSLRGADDWASSGDTDPPMNVFTNQGVVWQTTLGISRDFTKSFVASNRQLTPEGVENGTNLYIKDLATGTYTHVASAESFWGTFPLFLFVSLGAGGQLQASAPDFSWIVFRSEWPVKPGAPGGALYKWSVSDGLEVISVQPGPEKTQISTWTPGFSDRSGMLASNDGSRVYFTSEGPAGVYLWENGETRAISESAVSGEPDGPRAGVFWGASDDGRYGFFSLLEEGVKLTADAPGLRGDAYRYDAETGDLEYLDGRLNEPQAISQNYWKFLGISDDGETVYWQSEPESDIVVWHDGVLKPVSPLPSEGAYSWVSPNGRYFAFQALAADGGLRLFDRETEEVRCITCLSDGTQGGGEFPKGKERISGENVAQVVTDKGQVFFTSAARLVAADVNGVGDAYEYKDGKASLISPGNAPFEAFFLGISRDGDDAFFSTSQKLVGRDNDGAVDIYDARVDGGLPAQSPPVPQECLRDDCKATPGAGPELPFGGSEALSGPENVKPRKHKKCGKGKRAKKVKGKVRCVKKHTKHKADKNKKGGNR